MARRKGILGSRLLRAVALLAIVERPEQVRTAALATLTDADKAEAAKK